jgi:hypothetical protein
MTTRVRKGEEMAESTECGLAILHTLPPLRHSERSEESRARHGFRREGMRVFVADAARLPGLGEGESLLEARFFAGQRGGLWGAHALGEDSSCLGSHRAEAAQNDGLGLVLPEEGAAHRGLAILHTLSQRRHSLLRSVQNDGRGWPFGVISNVLQDERK